MKFNKEDKKYFQDVVFLVEATSHEYHFLWQEFSTEYLTLPYAPVESEKFKRWRVKWVQVTMGHGVTIGELDKRPIVVDISYAFLNDKKVMFYNGCSQLVDHKMIEEWLKHFTLDTVRWDNNTRWAHCDAMNFHHCLDALDVPRKG
jgi:hypothetical protein